MEVDDDAPILTRGSRVRAACKIWCGLQKHQYSKLLPVPEGTLGVVRHIGATPNGLIVYLVKFEHDGRAHWAEVALTMLREEIL